MQAFGSDSLQLAARTLGGPNDGEFRNYIMEMTVIQRWELAGACMCNMLEVERVRDILLQGIYTMKRREQTQPMSAKTPAIHMYEYAG